MTTPNRDTTNATDQSTAAKAVLATGNLMLASPYITWFFLTIGPYLLIPAAILCLAAVPKLLYEPAAPVPGYVSFIAGSFVALYLTWWYSVKHNANKTKNNP